MEYESLRRNNDFLRAYKRGTCKHHKDAVVYVYPKKRGVTRVGITASKKIGNAVARNRARRVIRHALQQLEFPAPGKWDVVIVARQTTGALKSYEMAAILDRQLKRAVEQAGRPQNGRPKQP